MEEDDSIYNVIIAALVIGIIIVIATLIIAKPKPETFTELYFTDHKSLPRYISSNSSYSLGFTIANHENSTKEYTFDITKTFYRFNRKCDSPTLYLEESDNLPSSKVAFSTDPSLYIKDPNYTVSFDYKVRDGKGTLAYIFRDINNKEKYSIRINNDKIHATVNNIAYEKDLQLNSTSTHHIDISAQPDSLKILADKEVLFHFSTLKPLTDTGVPIIMYNSYGRHSALNLSKINADIAYLKENGFETITLKEYYAWKNHETIPLPKKPIILVFDQGYRNIVANLSESNIKAVIGLTTGTASKYSSNYLIWRDLKEMEKKGWEIASCSETASDMLALNASLRYDQFNKSKSDIEKYLSSAALTFIYPQNRYNSTIEAECNSFYPICLSSVKYPSRLAKDLTAIETADIRAVLEGKKSDEIHVENKTSWNTKGFIELSLIETYADITNLVVNHNNEKQYVRVTHADTEYNNLELIKEELVIPDSEFYFLDNPLNFNKKTETHYRAKKPNLTSYTLEMAFKVENKGVAINVDDISFTYDEVTKELILENKTKIKVMPVKGYQRIELTVKNDSAKVYFNKEYVAEIPHEKSKEELKINTINSQADIGYVTVRSNTEPVIVNYRIPDKAPQKTLSLPSVSLVTQLQNLSSERQKEIMTTFFEYDSIFWDNYKLRTEYSITSINSSIKLVLTDLQKELYSIEVYNQTIELSYTKGGEVKKVLHTLQAIPSHKILVDAKGNNITINFDNVVVLKETLDKASRGVLLIDYNNLDIDKLQVENPDTGEIRSRETSSAECSPLLIKETIYTGTAIIEKDAKKAFRTTVNFKEEFDIAKVALQLDSGEEIHFWVTQE